MFSTLLNIIMYWCLMYWHLFTHVLCQVPGTRHNHCFIPVNNEQLKIFRVSSDNVGTLTCTTQQNETPHDATFYMPGKYVAAVYDQAWYAGNIVQFDQQTQDVLVSLTSWQPPEHMVHSSGPGKEMNAGCPQYCVLCQHRRQHQLDDNIILMSQPLQIQNHYFSSLLQCTFHNYVN
jgi:hypothetical protein